MAAIATLGEPTADLRSDIAAEARAKIVYERLIKQCADPGLKGALTFLMTREIAHQQMFESALAALSPNFPPGKLPGDEALGHIYVHASDSFAGKAKDQAVGFELAEDNNDWGFTLDDDPVAKAADQQIL